MPTKPPPIPMVALFGDGVVGAYGGRIGGLWTFEGARPGPGWHRHDWRPRQLIVVTDKGVVLAPLLRRRWRLAGTTITRQDRGPDEVGQRGDVQLCFSMRGLMGGNALGNVRTTPLRALWEGKMAGDARSVMSSCRQNCGMLNCHRRIES